MDHVFSNDRCLLLLLQVPMRKVLPIMLTSGDCDETDTLSILLSKPSSLVRYLWIMGSSKKLPINSQIRCSKMVQIRAARQAL
jgi:hypothetical protein